MLLVLLLLFRQHGGMPCDTQCVHTIGLPTHATKTGWPMQLAEGLEASQSMG